MQEFRMQEFILQSLFFINYCHFKKRSDKVTKSQSHRVTESQSYIDRIPAFLHSVFLHSCIRLPGLKFMDKFLGGFCDE